MPDRRELDKLSSQELHDRAVRLAVRRLDAAFLWKLLRALPPAEVAAGHLREATADVLKLSALLDDAMSAGRGDLAEALRPLYLDYVAEHEEHGDPPTALDSP